MGAEILKIFTMYKGNKDNQKVVSVICLIIDPIYLSVSNSFI